MRKPRPEDYSSHPPHRQPDPVNMDGLVPLSAKPLPLSPSNTDAEKDSEMFASLFALMKTIGQMKATNAATFRFPPELLERLEEVEYNLRKEHKIRATKNALVVAALAYLLAEHEQQGRASILYQYLTGE